jgi:hypothetical protein
MTARFGLSALMLGALGGHGEVVRVLVGAGARQDLRGSGAFAGQTVRDIAAARRDHAIADALGPERQVRARTPSPAFVVVDSWDAAAALLPFAPRVPRDAGGRALQGLRVLVCDHRRRDLAPARRSVEAHFSSVVLSQSQHALDDAKRRALDVAYGQNGYAVAIAGREGRAYPRDPDALPGDLDGPGPAVVVWADADMLFLLASHDATIDGLCRIGASIHDPPRRSGRR